MKRLLSILLSVLFVFVFCSCSQNTVEEAWSEKYLIGIDTNFELCQGLTDGDGKTAHVILLTGQSNCTGCSIISYLKDDVDEERFEGFSRGYGNILINYNIDNHRKCSAGQFVKVDLDCGSTEKQFGPEVGIAETLHKSYPDELFIILKFSMSGYSLNYHWLKDGERGEIYLATYLFVKQSLDYIFACNFLVSFDAVMFMQGESDTTTYKTSRYYDNLSNYVHFLREDFESYVTLDELYFIDAGISDSPYNEPCFEELNEQKLKFSKDSPFNIYFSTIDNGLTTLNEPSYEPDLGHYDALSELKLGNLFGEKYVEAIAL